MGNPAGLPPVAMKLMSASSLQCTSNTSWQHGCYPGNDIKSTKVSSAKECCAECSTVLGCTGWTFNPKSAEGHNCYIKKKLAKAAAGDGCLSGGTVAPPSPPSPAPPAPTPSGGVMLFNVMDDPSEHNDVSKEKPEIVAQLSKVLNAMRATAVQPSDQLNCDSSGGKKDTPQGTYVIPYCSVTTSALVV